MIMSTFWGSTDFYSTLIHTRRENAGNNARDDDDDAASELEILVHAYLRDVHYSTRRQTIFTVVYANLNAAFVALPMAAQFGGIPIFVAAVVLICVCAGYSSCMVVNMFSEQGVRTLEDLCTRGYGRTGFLIVCVFELLLSVSLMCITLDVWADISSNVLASFKHVPSRLTHRSFGLMIGAVLILPLCLLGRSMSKLRWSSTCSVICVCAALCCLIVALVCDLDGSHTGVQSRSTFKSLCSGTNNWWLLPLVVTFCVANNQKSFAAYSSLRRRSAHRWRYIITRAHTLLAILFITFGVCGFLSNVKIDRTLTNIDYFLEFDNTDSTTHTHNKNLIYFDILSAIVAVSFLLTVPVDCLVAVTTCKRIYMKLFRRKDHKKHWYLCSSLVEWLGHNCCSCMLGLISKDDLDGGDRKNRRKHKMQSQLQGDGGYDDEEEAAFRAAKIGSSVPPRASDLVDYERIYNDEGEDQDEDETKSYTHTDTTTSLLRNVARTNAQRQRQQQNQQNQQQIMSSEGDSTSRGSFETYGDGTKVRGDTWVSDEMLSPYTAAVAEEAERKGVSLSDERTPTQSITQTDKRGWRSFLPSPNSNKQQQKEQDSYNSHTSDATVIRNVIHSNTLSPQRANVQVQSQSQSQSQAQQATVRTSTNVSTKKMEALRIANNSEDMSVGSGSFDSHTLSMRADSNDIDAQEAIARIKSPPITNPTHTQVETILETASDASNHTHNTGVGRNSESERSGGGSPAVRATSTNSQSHVAQPQQQTHHTQSQSSQSSAANASKFMSVQQAALRKANTNTAITSSSPNRGSNNSAAQDSESHPQVRKAQSDNTIGNTASGKPSQAQLRTQSDAPRIRPFPQTQATAQVPRAVGKQRDIKDNVSSSSASAKSDTPHLDALMAAMQQERISRANSRRSSRSRGSRSNRSHSSRGFNDVEDGGVLFEPQIQMDSSEDEEEFGDEEEEDEDEDLEYTLDSQRIDLHTKSKMKKAKRSAHAQGEDTEEVAGMEDDDLDDAVGDENGEVIHAQDIDEHYRILQQRHAQHERDNNSWCVCEITEIGPVLMVWAFTLLLCASYEKLGMIGIIMGPISTAMLVYIIPSALYFRLGLATDFQVAPVCGILPNKLFMQFIQLFGICLLFGNFVIVLYALIVEESLISL